ncbi:hypothetical protein HCN44_009831 [Aphidius gifuensis]|uniref:Cerebellar degeneration-related protein 2 n=1 Tax=Aphidius gifuensis TaxID=684658 RepID=A0A834Y3Y9_APHGI|nr:inner centromere protein A isoform X2 [Aphidius gifuensis]KAF7996046.1 hypothetical protein HCN44_009831 [Aphidius gifuensis]
MSLLSSINARSLADEEHDRNMLQDLQLAAELGKTLLERNKELETNLKSHQTTIEEQTQEIEYMKKQTAALREVNDSRLKVYEQLEVSIQDLERANHRLIVENTADKKLIKSQGVTIENQEIKFDELQKKFDELKIDYESLSRQQNDIQSSTIGKTQLSEDCSTPQNAARNLQKLSPISSIDSTISNDDGEVTELLRQLHETRNQRIREQKRVNELREQLENLLKENGSLEEQLNEWRSKAQDIKNLQDEINTLEEVRQGKLCGRCLRGCDTRTHDELSIMLDAEEDDDLSIAESYLNDSRCDSDTLVQDLNNSPVVPNEININPYRVLVEKYEALLEVQRRPALRKQQNPPAPCLSLQEELEMSGDFNTFQNLSTDRQEDQIKMNGTTNQIQNHGKKQQHVSSTPTDFSEAETSSSGFSDETSNKGTQTDGRPGSFLCSIADGEDYKFSIYDDNSNFESRFQQTPEYRQLFSEIFGVLKRAAEAKDEGENLPLLDNQNQAQINHNDINNQQDESEITDDNQSIMSSAISSVVSEPVIRIQTPTPEKNDKKNKIIGQNQPQRHHQHRSLITDNLSMRLRKKNTAKKSAQKKFSLNERSITPDIIPSSSPKILQNKTNNNNTNNGKRNKFRPLTAAEQDGTSWNGNTLHIFPSKSREQHRRKSFTRFNEQYNKTNCEYKEYKPSSASEEVARLRQLEMSYAEVLRTPNKPKANSRRY